MKNITTEDLVALATKQIDIARNDGRHSEAEMVVVVSLSAAMVQAARNGNQKLATSIFTTMYTA
jgi:hypothetical protein